MSAVDVAVNNLMTTIKKYPSLPLIMTSMKESVNQPRREITNLLLNPLKERFIDAFAPLKSALAPLIEQYWTVMMAIYQPIIRICFEIVDAAGPLITMLAELLGTTQHQVDLKDADDWLWMREMTRYVELPIFDILNIVSFVTVDGWLTTDTLVAHDLLGNEIWYSGSTILQIGDKPWQWQYNPGHLYVVDIAEQNSYGHDINPLAE